MRNIADGNWDSVKEHSTKQLEALKKDISEKLDKCLSEKEYSISKAAVPFYTEYLSRINLEIAERLGKK